jgi:UDPglucose 6-dehydrogenase
VNVQQVARGIGLNNRIGSRFLQAGTGLVFLVALIKTGQNYKAPLPIVERVVTINKGRRRMSRNANLQLSPMSRGKRA